MLLWRRIASNAEEALRARLAQREHRLGELSAALVNMQSRAAEGMCVSSHSADEQCRQMIDAATRAEPLLKRLSNEGVLTSADTCRDPPHYVLASETTRRKAEADQMRGASADAQHDNSSREQEAQHTNEPGPHVAAEASTRRLDASTESSQPDTTSRITMQESDLTAPLREILQSTEADGPRRLTSAPGGSKSVHHMGVSAHTLQLAEEAEDLRLELAHRAAEAKGLQSRVDHLMACQSEHENTEASQASQLAEQSEVSHLAYLRKQAS